MNEQKVKLFIALDLPLLNDAGLPIQYEDVQVVIQNTFVNFRPLSPLHITLLFLGPTLEADVPRITKALQEAVERYISQETQGDLAGITGLMIASGAHMMGKNAITMTVLDNQSLIRLVLYIQTSLKENNIPFEALHHENIGHITIGRIPKDTLDELQLKRVLDQLEAPLGARATAHESFTAHTITLYQSLPGSNYTPLQAYQI